VIGQQKGVAKKMESEWFDVDVYRLINLYELHPTLYDVTEVNYRNREMKKFLESQIAYSLNKPGMIKQLRLLSAYLHSTK